MPRLTRAESQARTREALLDAAARVFVERGLHGASVDAITAEAGYTRGAFYSNFESKEQLFVELLQQRAFQLYRDIAQRRLADPGYTQTLRETGEELAAIQADPDGRWMFRLWLELLAHADRDERLRSLAAGFWSGTRALTAETLRRSYRRSRRKPPLKVEALATALIALDIGLALQHYVDPDEVGLDLYPQLYELLFSPHAP